MFGSPLARALASVGPDQAPDGPAPARDQAADGPAPSAARSFTITVTRERGGFPFFAVRVEEEGAEPWVRGGSVRAAWRHVRTGLARNSAMCVEALELAGVPADARVLLRPPTATVRDALRKHFDKWAERDGMNAKGVTVEGFWLLKTLRERVRPEDILDPLRVNRASLSDGK